MNDPGRPTAVEPRKSGRLAPPASVGELLNREDYSIKLLSSVKTKFLPPERALRLAIQAVRHTPELAQCTPSSFMGALMSATGLGLEPNTPLQQAFLIPYKLSKPRRLPGGKIAVDQNGKWIWDEHYECNFQIGFRGYTNLFYRHSLVVEVNADAVRAGDHFRHRKGTETILEYEKNLTGDVGELIGAFCHVKLRDGQAFTVLRASDVLALRARSQTYNSLVKAVDEAKSEKDRIKAERKLAETPWVAWGDRMWTKSAIRQHAAVANLTMETAVAAQLDGLSDAGKLDMTAMSDPDKARAIFDGEYEIGAPSGDDEDDDDGDTPGAIEHKPEQPMQFDTGAQRAPEVSTRGTHETAQQATQQAERKRGRPSREEMERREREKQQQEAARNQPQSPPPAPESYGDPRDAIEERYAPPPPAHSAARSEDPRPPLFDDKEF